MPDKPKKECFIRRMRKVSGRKRNLLIIIAGIILGASTQYLITHGWYIGNSLLGMFIDIIIYRNCNAALYEAYKLYDYLCASYIGMTVEMIALIIVMVFMVFFFKNDENDEMVSILKEMRDDIKGIKRKLRVNDGQVQKRESKRVTSKNNTK